MLDLLASEQFTVSVFRFLCLIVGTCYTVGFTIHVFIWFVANVTKVAKLNYAMFDYWINIKEFKEWRKFKKGGRNATT